MITRCDDGSVVARRAGTAIALTDPAGANAIARKTLRMEIAMPPQTIESRVEKLEERVTILEQLPARVDALGVQISQLRDEMTAGFSAVSGRFEALEKTLRDEIRGEIRGVNERIDGVDVRISGRIDAMGVRIGGLEERLSTQMRVLHEDVISRLQLIQEGQPRRRKRRS